MAVKLRKPIEIPVENGASPEAPQPIPLKPLAISAVCISRAALIEALRIYLPTIVNIEVVEDGERFLLTVAASDGECADSHAEA